MRERSVPAWRSVPRTVWALGFVSLLMDVSSEMIHALLPVFLVSTLGAGASLVGLIEGIGEGAASVTKLFSGVISDRLGRRKQLALVGYGLAAVTKPVFAIATGAAEVLAARLVDRVGKGIRGAPRDALVADVTPGPLLGAAYGLRQALDTVGAFAGPLFAMALLAATGGNLRVVFAVAALPALASVALLAVAVRDPEPKATDPPTRPHFRREALRALDAPFWGVIALGAVVSLARFSEAFLVLRSHELGLALGLVPLVLVAMNAVYSLVSTPAGTLSDRVDRRVVLAAGLVALIAADLVLVAAEGVAVALVGAGLWGLHMGLTQGLLAAMVADTAPERLRGTAFGLFHLVTGFATFLASVLAGLLWDGLGSSAPFACSAALAALALVASAGLRRRPA